MAVAFVGAITMAIGGALFESIQFENGKILNPHFASYRVPRFSDLPSIETVIMVAKTFPQPAPEKLRSSAWPRLSATLSSMLRASVCVRCRWYRKD